MNTNLSKLSFYNTLFSIVVFSVVLAYFIYQFSDNLYHNKVKELEKSFFEKSKILVQKEVNRTVSSIITLRENSYKDSKVALQEKVEIVRRLFDNDKSSDQLSVLLSKYGSVLDTIKWDNDTGYIYIFDEKGKILYHGVNKEAEEKNILEIVKHNKKLLSFLNQTIIDEEGFSSYKWVKPNEADNSVFEKFVYIQKDQKYNIYIAAGIYKDEIDKKIINLVRHDLYTNRFGDNDYGYFWINGLDNQMKIHSMDHSLEGKDFTSLKTLDGQNALQVMNQKALRGGGFVEYKWKKPNSTKLDHKISYVKLIDGWPLVLGSGFYESNLLDILENEKQQLRELTNEYIINIVSILLIMIVVVFFITKFISSKIKKVEDERIEQMNMFEQYKLILDKSLVVSKANKKGYITYVNDKFEKISKYSKEDVIGKPHNVVRHPDSPPEKFEDLWKTITQGKIWKGIIKNKTKNGDVYYNKTTIVPIKDPEGSIVEYISSGSDLTELFNLHEEIEDTQKEVIYKMGEIGETRSKETGNHVKRVAEYSKLLGELYGLGEKEVEVLFTASPMHDIGKVGIPDSVLKKPGKLTEEEFVVMKSHSEIGYNILKGSKREVLKAASIVAYEHHEKWDGTGYPRGLKEEEIHVFGRITAIADVFDALGSVRCYKDAWEDVKIFALLKEQSGKQFEPKLIELFFENFEKFDKIRQTYKDV